MATTVRPDHQSAPPAAPPTRDQGATAAPASAPLAPPKPRRRLIMILAAAVVGASALIWGLNTWVYSRAHESTDDAYVEGHLVPVLAKVGGYVVRVTGEENVHVKEGDTIVVIDDAETRAKLAQARADLAAAEVGVGRRGYTGQALAQVHTAQGQSAATDAQIAAAQANYDRAVSDLQRTRTLADQQIISRQQLDGAQAAADAAHATLIAAEKQAAAAGATVTNAEAGVRLAQARLAAAQAEVDEAELNESYTRIVAPVSGVLSRKQVELGQLVQSGQTLFTIVADTGVWVTANYKETQLNDIRVGQHVEFDVDAYGGRQYNGVVESIAAATGAEFALLPPDNATGNFTKVVQRIPIRIRPTDPVDPIHPLRPGMSVNCHIDVKGTN
jgi:membrane fusion protein (multidrug efflux system)